MSTSAPAQEQMKAQAQAHLQPKGAHGRSADVLGQLPNHETAVEYDVEMQQIAQSARRKEKQKAQDAERKARGAKRKAQSATLKHKMYLACQQGHQDTPLAPSPVTLMFVRPATLQHRACPSIADGSNRQQSMRASCSRITRARAPCSLLGDLSLRKHRNRLFEENLPVV